MNSFVRSLAILLIVVMLAVQFASCMPRPENNPSTPNEDSTGNNGEVILPPSGGNNEGDNEGGNNGNDVGGVVVGNVTAPYIADVHVSVGVTPDENNQVPAEGVNLDSSLASATVPGGVQMAEGATELALTINGVKDSKAEIELLDTEVSSSLDVHVEGIAAGNLVPMEVKLAAAAAIGLNSSSVKLYHVENGETIEMTLISNDAEFTAHNQFKYDPATGDITLYVASFSEFAVVLNTENKWEGSVDHSWYKADEEELVIANAEQLWSFSQIVGGMAEGIEQDSFSGKTVKLIADINLGDKESENNESIIFYPIGYWNNEGTYERKPLEERTTPVSSGFYTFEGTFDGSGHTISNFYQNTWEMKGDHDWYNTTTEQYYRDGMGLFGKVYGGTVMNLTVENFSSDGEITTTGVIAAYADGATFQNITIFNCNPRVYNIGNGGIVGCVGWYAKEAGLKTTFTNITVDNSNKISALWGSYDVACGGIVGQYYPTSGQSSAEYPVNAGIEFTNCHVSAVMDVYNDVCANYQYYAYRYTGMLIGSVRENETIDGRVYPKMDGIKANGCTVHYGDWNDYYYCELVANTTASYTHDHQMSRLTQVLSVDVANMQVTDLDGNTTDIPTSGRVNYVVVKAKDTNGMWIHGDGHDFAECYHFVDGAVWNHENAGYHNGENGEKFIDEDGDGVGDLKEDKQLIYREFNNLVTGYGWGVTSKGVEDVNGVVILDREVGDSIDKFEVVGTDDALAPSTGSTINIGTLFNAKDQTEVELLTNNIIVSVTPLGEDSTVRATYAINIDDWTLSTLTFSGVGLAKVTITDYFFCNPTSVTIDVQPVDKFEYKHSNKDFLFRVGNQNAVSLNLLFSAIENCYPIDLDTLTVTATNGTFTKGNTWGTSTVNFKNYTGVSTITIKDSTSYPCEIKVEVVAATNTIAASSADSRNIVLLQDANGSFNVSNGYTFYGNGFTVTLPTNAIGKYSAGFTGYITLNNGNLDNVRIEGPVYPEMYIYRDQAKITDTNDPNYSADQAAVRYFINAVLINGGNVTISNSYISGARTALCIRGGNNVVIENTTLYGGSYANMQIAGASTVTLRDLTTVQVDVADSYGKGKNAHGLGIAVDSAVVDIYIEGELKQHNWLNESQWTSIVPSEYQSSFPDFFGNNKYSKYWHYLNGGSDPYVNLAFIFACNWDTSRIHDNRTTVDYGTTDSTIASVAGGVYSKVNTVGGNAISDTNIKDPGYTSTGFNPIAPIFNFDNSANNDADDTNDASDAYCVYDESSGILQLGLTGNSKVLDLSGISIAKDGKILTHTTYLNGTQINSNSVTINAADGTTQTLTFKVASNDAGYDKNGNPIAGSIEYSWNIKIEVATLSYPAPEWNMGGNYTFDKTNLYYVYYQTSQGYGEAVPIYEGIKINYHDKNGNPITLDLSGTQTTPTGSNNSNAYAFTYTLGDGSTLTMKFVSGWKSGATTHQFAVYNNKLYIYPQSLDNDNYVRAKTTNQDFNVQITYTFTDPNGQSTDTVTMTWYNAKANNSNITTVQWKTFDSTNGKKPSCVTGDTLVTLADGSQVRIDSLTGNELVKVWDFYKGEYTVAPIAILQNHGYSEFDEVKLIFSDGTEINTINGHGFFDIATNKFVIIDKYNVADYVGHEFVKYDAENEYSTVTLVDYRIEARYEQIYSILTAVQYNCLLNDLWTLTAAEVDNSPEWLMPYEIGEDMKYDAEKMQADIEKYGLYTYEDFAGLCTYEEFVALGLENFKVSVGKGAITWEDILFLINLHLN